MAFLRVKPVRKLDKLHHYVYEVESYKHKGKVKQRTLQFLGKYVRLNRQKDKKFPLSKVAKHDNREALLKEIFSLNLVNYGFEEINPQIFKSRNLIADLNNCKVFDEVSGKNIYINMNEKFFGSYTLKNALKSDSVDFTKLVKIIVDSGAINKENKHGFRLLQLIIEKFMPEGKMEETSFEKFAKEIGY